MSIIQEVFETIIRNPGTDTPQVCIEVHSDIEVPEQWTGPFLAAWLIKNESRSWIATCEAVDALIAEGQVSFGDDGELHATGYMRMI